MMLFIKLAVRNVSRNIKSTLLNGIGISFSVAVLLFILSLSRGIESQIISRNIKFETGALSVVFDKKTASLQNKAEGDSLLKRLVSLMDNNKEISSYSFRIYPTNSLLYFNDKTQSVKIIGLSKPEIPLIKEILEITDGNTNISNQAKKVIISNGIADMYGIKAGDNCNLMLQSVDGTINIDDFIIEGIFRYTSQLNKYDVYMNYEEAKVLYNTNLPSKIVVNIHNLDKANNVKKYLVNKLACSTSNIEGEIECNGMTISSFKDHIGMAKALSGINKYGMLSIASFLVLISFVGIWSMQVENINERRKEMGSLLSFGFSCSSIKKIFLYESLYISILFFTIGFLLVLLSVLIINHQNGIYLGDSASFAFGSAIVNPILTVNDSLATFIVAIAYPLIATGLSLNAINRSKIIELLNGN